MKLLITILTFFLITPAVQADTSHPGKEKFITLCMSCHKLDRSEQMVAPPVFAVRHHYIRAYPGRADFIAQVVEWLEEPDPNVSLMPGAMRRFNLMPKQELTSEERENVAAFLYDANFNEPDWYREHFEQGHGTKE